MRTSPRPIPRCLVLVVILSMIQVGPPVHAATADVSFVLLRLDWDTHEIEHAYEFIQPYQETAPPDDPGVPGGYLLVADDFYVDFLWPEDFGYTEIHSSLTGQIVYRATSVSFGGAGVVEWPTEAEEIGNYAYGAPPAAADAFDYLPLLASIYTEEEARAAWESVSDLDLISALAAAGPFGVFVSDHQFSAPFGPREWLVFAYSLPPTPVDIDIRPGDSSNTINPSGRGVVPVALLGSGAFDIMDVDTATLAFGPGGALPVVWFGPPLRDVNRDGFPDLLAMFPIGDAGITYGATEACLVGTTAEGVPFMGCDVVTTSPWHRTPFTRERR